MSETLTVPEGSVLAPAKPEYSEPGDDEKFSHYADRNKVAEAYFTGTPVMALCGKFWVPTRDPEKFPVCPECKEVYESLPTGDES